jgi:hypothetical protein
MRARREEMRMRVRHLKSRTTLALLQTLHAQPRFWVERLIVLLPAPVEGEGEMVVELTPRDMLELELGPLSILDAHSAEWLAGGVRAAVCTCPF